MKLTRRFGFVVSALVFGTAVRTLTLWHRLRS
jgi:hypothetical protein